MYPPEHDGPDLPPWLARIIVPWVFPGSVILGLIVVAAVFLLPR